MVALGHGCANHPQMVGMVTESSSMANTYAFADFDKVRIAGIPIPRRLRLRPGTNVKTEDAVKIGSHSYLLGVGVDTGSPASAQIGSSRWALYSGFLFMWHYWKPTYSNWVDMAAEGTTGSLQIDIKDPSIGHRTFLVGTGKILVKRYPSGVKIDYLKDKDTYIQMRPDQTYIGPRPWDPSFTPGSEDDTNAKDFIEDAIRQAEAAGWDPG